jgi:hypothetical protein
MSKIIKISFDVERGLNSFNLHDLYWETQFVDLKKEICWRLLGSICVVIQHTLDSFNTPI